MGAACAHWAQAASEGGWESLLAMPYPSSACTEHVKLPNGSTDVFPKCGIEHVSFSISPNLVVDAVIKNIFCSHAYLHLPGIV